MVIVRNRFCAIDPPMGIVRNRFCAIESNSDYAIDTIQNKSAYDLKNQKVIQQQIQYIQISI
jgi:uncharacterized protein YchJ